jgi:hypothetical protein
MNNVRDTDKLEQQDQRINRSNDLFSKEIILDVAEL